ncbi:MFS transporter [Paraburkholderia caribensis]|uniref:MFS transporter n=1 Tax=Paraburkholderia caribensis TaxID=75105 RepID=UPI000721863A|nr:MFS transporter [Paraburkholderia caribensis]ALP68521.1 MFS transporter [Paraburkholderia caribensis]AUT57876.1 MFS transporter [Paraburkholderia caribensis]
MHPTIRETTAPAFPQPEEFKHWRRNLLVCVCGSFTTIVAMTLMLPFLPLYVEELGVSDRAAIVQWSGVAFGATFFTAALTAPIWGKLADRYGRKLMLVRASLGMAIVMSLMGSAHNIWQLVALRLLAGLLGGYASGSTVLVATQTPQARCGWALGILASGIMAGNVAGPLIGGTLPSLIGIRSTFHAVGAVIFATFLATIFFIKRDPPAAAHAGKKSGWNAINDTRPVFAMLLTGMLLMLANMSIEPIITVYVAQLVQPHQVAFVSGLVMSGAALGSVLSASPLGKLADRVGHWKVIIASLVACAVLLIPQAFVTQGWELVVLRFLMGVALGGLLPCIASVIRHSVPSGMAGAMLGYSTSSQYAGQVVGPLIGGFVGGHVGMRAVFWATAVLMAAGAMGNGLMRSRVEVAQAKIARRSTGT